MNPGVFVYGVVDPETEVPRDLLGIDDAPVRVVAVYGDPIGALISDLQSARPPRRKADLLAYSRVLDTVAASGLVAPVRFGSLMDDEMSVVEDFLAPNVEWFCNVLEGIRDRVQYTLRATYDEATVLREVVQADREIGRLHQLTRDAPADTALAERVRLGELVASALESKREWDAEMIWSIVSPHVDAMELKTGSSVDHVLKAALLVERSRQSEIEDVLEGLAESIHERIHLSLVGPLAAYDFVEEH
jgi:hypothetical protein